MIIIVIIIIVTIIIIVIVNIIVTIIVMIIVLITIVIIVVIIIVIIIIASTSVFLSRGEAVGGVWFRSAECCRPPRTKAEGSGIVTDRQAREKESCIE